MELSFDTTPVTLILLIVTIGASLAARPGSPAWEWMALVPIRMVKTREFHPLITSGLVHANGFHLLINMYVLFMFGRVMELTLGPKLFLLLYIVSLLCGSLWPFIKYRRHPAYIAVGASGAISGLLFGFSLIYPLEMIYLFFILPMPAFVFAILYVVYSIFAMKRIDDNIGHEAHLGGGLAGLIFTLVIRPDIITSLLG